ncbi:MAG: orotidine-5'-phosphate decarboxylase [Thermodesulfobacteriota bacterium]|nr:orotidine-5'-phosphate decarboxylase [Thermodesulfobacteriota bacterium]
MSQEKRIDINKRIIFALDVDSPEEAKKWVEKLEGQVKFYKVGLELFLAGWFPMIEWIIKRDLEVMVDLKFFDVPETVGRAVRQLKDCGATFATVHGNDGILKAAAQNKANTQILAVTVLTSLDQGDIRELGFDCSVEDLVLNRAKRAIAMGCDGVVSSGLEASKLRAHLGDGFLVVVPGVRPVQNRRDDQKRVVDVRTAFKNGADYIVVGRPIRQADDPVAVVERMQTHIAGVVSAP